MGCSGRTTYPVLHADETPVAMLDPGAGKTHRAYLWSYSIVSVQRHHIAEVPWG
jgi:hypothetical protein